MYVPVPGTFDLFSPYLLGVDMAERELYEEPFDMDVFLSSARNLKDVLWQRLPTACAGDTMSGEWMSVRSIAGMNDDLLSVAQTISGERGDEDVILDRLVRTDGVAHECLLLGTRPDKAGIGQGVSVSINASVRPGWKKLTYRYAESLQLSGSGSDMARTACRIVSSQNRLRNLSVLSAPRHILSNERELLGAYRRKMSDLAGFRVSDAAGLSSALVANGFSDDELKGIDKDRIPKRFYRFSSWSFTVGSHGAARMSVKSETGTFLHAPPVTDEERGAWVGMAMSFIDGTTRLASFMWNHRNVLLFNEA